MGIPWHASFNSMRMVQTPKLIVLTYQANNNNPSRTIYLDGRDLPKDPEPTWHGYSVGRWEGDTLVVTTAGFNDRTWLDTAGHPQTESLRITERMRRRDLGHMDFEYTVEDPKAFKRPITIKIDRQLAPDEDLREDVCVELNKSAGHLVGGSSFVPKKATLATYAGIYALPSGEEVTVTVRGGDLVYVRGPGEFFESKMPLFPIADGQFMSSGPGAFSPTPNIYEFGKDAKGNVSQTDVEDREGREDRDAQGGVWPGPATVTRGDEVCLPQRRSLSLVKLSSDSFVEAASARRVRGPLISSLSAARPCAILVRSSSKAAGARGFVK